MINKLLVLTSNNDEYLHALRRYKLDNLLIMGDNAASIIEANIWLAEPSLAAPIIQHGRSLQWLQSTFAGIEPLIGQKVRHNYQLTNVKNLFGPMMSEYVFGHLLSLYKHHRYYDKFQRSNNWHPMPHKQLHGRRMLILGTGDIGKHLASTAKHFGMYVLGINKHGNNVEQCDETHTIEQLDTLLPFVDVVVCALPATELTNNIFDKQRLSLLKNDVVFVNVGRGNIVDEQALLMWLALHPTSHAILDVFKHEPLSDTNPLWKCQNATLTPHIAAPSNVDDVVEQFIDNYRRFMAQQPLNNPIDFSLGY